METDKDYLKLAREVLEILEIRYSEEDSLEKLIKKIENSYRFISSTTEIRLQELARDIAAEIKKRGDVNRIRKLMKELEDNYNYSKYWD